MKKLIIVLIFLLNSVQAQRAIIIDRSKKTIDRSFRNNGGSLATKKALEKSLEWLKKAQNPDGSWGKEAKDTITAFALKSFLANGILPNTPNLGNTVNKAIDYLSKQEVSERNGRGYGHLIQTIAIGEAYGMTGNLKLKKILDQSIRIIIDGQQKIGAFDYFLKNDSNRQDMSISSWGFQALKTAKEAGCTEEGLEIAIIQATEFLTRHTTGTNEFYYSTRDNKTKIGKTKHTMRAAGTVSLINLSNRIHPELKNDLKLISTDDLKNLNWSSPPKESLYGWFYATQALFHSGNSKWSTWYKTLQKEMLKNQDHDGFWSYPSDYNSHPMKDSVTKQIYATTLCILSLSTPFRFPKDRMNAVYNIPLSRN